MIPRYIKDNQGTFLLIKQYIRERRYGIAIMAAKETGSKRLTQRIQQYIDKVCQKDTKH